MFKNTEMKKYFFFVIALIDICIMLREEEGCKKLGRETNAKGYKKMELSCS